MKAVVMEKDKDNIIVMTRKGQFISMYKSNNNLNIGDEIVLENNRSPIIRRIASMAAVLILLFVGSYGVYGYYAPYGYVNVDINPSIQLTYNLYNRVIRIEGINEDGKKVVNSIEHYKNKRIDEIVKDIVDEAVINKYISENKDNAVLVTITENGKKVNEKNIYKSIDKHIKNTDIDTKLMLIKNSKGEFDAAKDKNMSAGKIALINKVISQNESIDINDVSQKSVGEIMKLISKDSDNEKNKLKNKKNSGQKDDDLLYDKHDKNENHIKNNSDNNANNKSNKKNQNINKESKSIEKYKENKAENENKKKTKDNKVRDNSLKDNQNTTENKSTNKDELINENVERKEKNNSNENDSLKDKDLDIDKNNKNNVKSEEKNNNKEKNDNKEKNIKNNNEEKASSDKGNKKGKKN